MFIIAGLGNPGRKYAGTRHNCGFEALDIIADRYRIDVSAAHFQAKCGSGMIGPEKVLLMKPQTYMNLSGDALQAACSFYKIDPETNLVVICDDVSMEPGQIRVRTKGSAGGHNGLKSIITMLGTQNFKRVKIGVGEKPEGWDLADYVLSRFPLSMQTDMIDAYDRAARAAAALVTEPPETVMNLYNQKNRSVGE